MTDSVTFSSEVPEEDQKHIAEMAAKGEALENGESPASASEESNADRPDWLPEKFKTPEDMAAAYAELEKKQGKDSGGEPTDQSDTDQNDPSKDTLEVSEQEANEAAEKAGVDMAELRKEFTENGQLSEDTYEALKEKGFEKADVDAYIAGVQAKATAIRDEGFGFTDGENNYRAMAEWMQQNLSVEQRQAYNNALKDDAARETTIRGMYSRYTAAVGSEPGRNVNGDAGNSAPTGYASRHQMTEAISDPRYAKDPAYRKEVAARIEASQF